MEVKLKEYISKMVLVKNFGRAKRVCAEEAFKAGYMAAKEKYKNNIVKCKTCKHKELITIECKIDDCKYEAN